jgi:ribosomal protein S18 acetylase RimI-like enzyme
LEIDIRRLASEDVPAWLELVDGAADAFGMERPTPEARQRLIVETLAQSTRLHVLIAAYDQKLIGYACYYLGYTSFKARPVLHLEDLFILETYRSQGIGRALLRACAGAAIEADCARMEWFVQIHNPRAIEFYRRLGASVFEEFRLCGLQGESLRTIAE